MTSIVTLGLLGTASELLLQGFDVSSGSPPDDIADSSSNLTSRITSDLTDAFFRLDAGNRSLADDLANAFFRVSMGWAENASLGGAGATNIPVSGGTAVIGIFDDGTVDGDSRGGPRWWAKESDSYSIGRYITISTRGTYRIEAIRPQDDGLILECLLESVS